VVRRWFAIGTESREEKGDELPIPQANAVLHGESAFGVCATISVESLVSSEKSEMAYIIADPVSHQGHACVTPVRSIAFTTKKDEDASPEPIS